MDDSSLKPSPAFGVDAQPDRSTIRFVQYVEEILTVYLSDDHESNRKWYNLVSVVVSLQLLAIGKKHHSVSLKTVYHYQRWIQCGLSCCSTEIWTA